MKDWLEILRGPFVLLDFEDSPRLYRPADEPLDIRVAEEVLPALDRLRGRDAVGFATYEAGFALERRLSGQGAALDMPLLWFMVDPTREEPPPLPDPDGAWAGEPSPLIDRGTYASAVEAIQTHILEGDIYQANFTFQAEVKTAGHPLALYAQLRQRAQARWGAIVYTGAQWILSFSPELFFTCENGRVTCRPMKGTAHPSSDPESLRSDPKQRSENLMIVDLLRNDLSRVARPGSVQVPELFAVERYPTVLQMTSTVTGELQDGLGPTDILRAMFPCGSITGAPKIRAMEIIGEFETSPRGIYTGSIGRLSAQGDAAFNVAIRSLVLREGESIAYLGLGSGIVADSRASDEWDECLSKGGFVASRSDFRLIETMRIDESGRLPDLRAHLDRLERSAATFGFRLDRTALEGDMATRAAEHGNGRLRLELSRDGSGSIETSPLPQTPALVEVAVAERTVDPHDFRLAHKTSDRAFYDEPRSAAGVFEVLYTDAEGFLTEGSFTNLFIERDGRLVTPPASRGLLPGILRERLMTSGEAVEGDVRVEDLGNGFYIGNALRGLIRARISP